MLRLHDPARHEALTSTPWSETAAREAVTRIANDALRAFTPDALWPAHPLDDPDTPESRHAMLYFGAGGVIWALDTCAASARLTATSTSATPWRLWSSATAN